MGVSAAMMVGRMPRRVPSVGVSPDGMMESATHFLNGLKALAGVPTKSRGFHAGARPLSVPALTSFSPTLGSVRCAFTCWWSPQRLRVSEEVHSEAWRNVSGANTCGTQAEASVPFVLDVRGKWGREAHAFVQAMVGGLPKEKRADAGRSCRRAVAVALQTGVANQIHAAGKAPDLYTEVLYTPSVAHTAEDAAMQAHSHDELPHLDETEVPLGQQAASPGSVLAAAGE